MQTKHGVDVMDQYDSGVDFDSQDYQRLEQGDTVTDGAYLASTPEGIYEVPGNMSEGDLAREIDLDTEQVNIRQISYDGSRKSATANRAAERHFNEISGMNQDPADILGGRVQEKSGQRTSAVQQKDNPPVDRID